MDNKVKFMSAISLICKFFQVNSDHFCLIQPAYLFGIFVSIVRTCHIYKQRGVLEHHYM